MAAAAQARLAAFGAEIGWALTRRDSLDSILQRCAAAMARFLNASLARIWVKEGDSLQLAASTGPTGDPAVLGSKTQKLTLDLADLAKGKPVLINQLQSDPALLEREWAVR